MPVRRHPVAAPTPGAPLSALPIDLALAARLRATYARIRGHGDRLAQLFYARLFDAAPHLRPLFRGNAAAQAAKLTAALDAVVRNFEKPRETAGMLAELGRRHAAYGAKPEHYALVTDLLVDSMRELLTNTTRDLPTHPLREPAPDSKPDPRVGSILEPPTQNTERRITLDRSFTPGRPITPNCPITLDRPIANKPRRADEQPDAAVNEQCLAEWRQALQLISNQMIAATTKAPPSPPLTP